MNGRLHNLHHLLSNELLVGSFSIAGSLNLSWCFLGESNAEHSDDVSIGGLGLDESLNKSVPLSDHGASLISGDVHTMEVSVAVKSLNLINLELELSPVLGIGRGVAISEGGAENTTSQRVGRVYETGSLVNWGHSDASLIEAWSKHIVPFLFGEWVATITKD